MKCKLSIKNCLHFHIIHQYHKLNGGHSQGKRPCQSLASLSMLAAMGDYWHMPRLCFYVIADSYCSFWVHKAAAWLYWLIMLPYLLVCMWVVVWMLTPQRCQHISDLILQTINEIKSLLTLKQPFSPSLFLPPPPPLSLPLGPPVCYHFICSLPPRQAEEVFVEERDSDVPGHEWERVARLCDFNPKNNKNTKDVSRMRSLFLQLKQTPPVH